MLKLHTARTFSRHDWWILFQAWFLLVAVDLGLRVLPFRWIQRAVEHGWRGIGNPREREVTGTIQRLGRLVSIAARHHLYPMLCLRRSLVLQWLLGRRGIVADLRFGAQKEEDDFSAHAWLEHEGRSISEPQAVAARFAPLVAWETGRRAAPPAAAEE